MTSTGPTSPSTSATTTAWSCSASHARSTTGAGRASGSGCRAAIENRLVPGRYYLDCWVRQNEQPDARGASRGCGCSVRRLRDRAARRRGHRRRRTVAATREDGRCAGERPTRCELRDVPGPSALGGGLPPRARAAVRDRGHRLQEDLLRHRARLPVVAGAAAADVRGAARGVHARLPLRRDASPTIRCSCCSTSSCSGSSRRRRRWRSARSSATRRSCARPSSRGW